MRQINILLASPGYGNRQQVLCSTIFDLFPSSDFSSVTYLAPDTFVVSEFRKHFFTYFRRQRNQKACIPFSTFTLSQLSKHLFNRLGTGILISAQMRILVFYHLMKDKNSGYARLLSDMYKKIHHFVLDRDTDSIATDICDMIFDEKARQRAADAMELLQSYETFMKEMAIVDDEAAMERSVSWIGTHFHPDTSLIDSFFDPTPLERRMLLSIIEASKRCYILAEDGSEFATLLKSSYKDASVHHLKSDLHRRSSGYFLYPSLEDEIEEIVKNIKKRLIEGALPWEITLTFPQISKYLPLLKRILKKHEIPFSTWHSPASGHPAAVVVREIFNCLSEDYPRNSLLTIITFPLFVNIPDHVKQWSIHFSYRAGLIKGKKAWLSLKENLLAAWTTEISEEEKQILDEVQETITRIIRMFDDLEKEKRPGHFGDILLSVLASLGFFERPNEGNAPAATKITDQIKNLLEQFSRISDFFKSPGAGHAHPDSYIRFILQDLSVQEENINGVRILPLEHAAVATTSHLFFGGVVEGDFPSRPAIDPLLPEHVKKDIGLPHFEYYLDRQRKYFHRLLNISSAEPFISCHAAEGDKLFLPSPYLDWNQPLEARKIMISSREDILVLEGAQRHVQPVNALFLREKVLAKTVLPLLRKRIRKTSGEYIHITSLDFYRKCPLRFYIERILNLRIEDPPRFEIEFRQWGMLAHKVMELLLESRDLTMDNFSHMLMQCIEKALKMIPLGRFWSKVAYEIFRYVTPLLKEQESELRRQGYLPHATETALSGKIGNIKLRGKIDRVDISTYGSSASINHRDPGGSGKAILLDYKTGIPDRKSLQLPLYVWLWNENRDEIVEKTGYYSLRDGQITWQQSGENMTDFIEEAIKSAEALLANLNNGVFSPLPASQAECRHCYHSPLCEGVVQ